MIQIIYTTELEYNWRYQWHGNSAGKWTLCKIGFYRSQPEESPFSLAYGDIPYSQLLVLVLMY